MKQKKKVCCQVAIPNLLQHVSHIRMYTIVVCTDKPSDANHALVSQAASNMKSFAKKYSSDKDEFDGVKKHSTGVILSFEKVFKN